MNAMSPKKRKLTYPESKKVYTELVKIAHEATIREGRVVPVAEVVRIASLAAANEHRKKNGKKMLDIDPSAGKFMPSGGMAANQCIVNADGRAITVYSKSNSVMSAYQKLSQLPTLLRHFPKVKMVYEDACKG